MSEWTDADITGLMQDIWAMVANDGRYCHDCKYSEKDGSLEPYGDRKEVATTYWCNLDATPGYRPCDCPGVQDTIQKLQAKVEEHGH